MAESLSGGAPADSPPERDAILYLSGLGRTRGHQSVDDMARRVAFALDQHAASGAARFLVKEGQSEDFGGYQTRVVTVVRKDEGDDERPVADLYGLDYREPLLRHSQDKRPISHLMATARVFFANTIKLWFTAKRHGKSSKEKWQLRTVWFLYLVLFLYLLVLLGAVVSSLQDVTVNNPTENNAATVQATAGFGGQDPAPEPDDPAETGVTDEATGLVARWSARVAGALEPSARWLQLIVIWLTALGLWTKFDVKAWIEQTGIEVTAADDYLALDKRRSDILGQFGALLNHIEEKATEGVEYRRTHVLSYSFGTIVALDALFPQQSSPSARFDRIDALVTIGCPFDFIRTYWPQYFQNRKARDQVPRTWINVFARPDVLASDFRDEAPQPMLGFLGRRNRPKEESEPRRQGIHVPQGEALPHENLLCGRDKSLDDYSWPERMFLVGFRMHSSYWDGTAGAAVDCLDLVVPRLYEDDWVLS